MPAFIKYPINIGDQFNQWTVLEKVKGPHDRQFRCRCSCGTIKLVTGPSLAAGESKSCGCYRNNYRRKNDLSPAFNYLVNSYKRSAKKRKLEWALSDDDCLRLFKGNCYFCGVEPKQQASYKNNRPQLEIWKFLHNGIDRLNSTIGYTAVNTVPACKFCNYAKKDHPLEDFYTWIDRLIKYQNGNLRNKKSCANLRLVESN